jgi:hypothetical protein
VRVFKGQFDRTALGRHLAHHIGLGRQVGQIQRPRPSRQFQMLDNACGLSGGARGH